MFGLNPTLQHSSTPALQWSEFGSFVFHGSAVAADQDEAIRVFLLVPSAITFGQQAPRRGQLLPTATRLGFTGTSSIGMVDRVARDAAVDGPYAPVTRPAGFAEDDIFVFSVADLSDGSVA